MKLEDGSKAEKKKEEEVGGVESRERRRDREREGGGRRFGSLKERVCLFFATGCICKIAR